MAEIIEEHIEDRLPELLQLERVGLFTRKEIKAVIKKASALEYKVQRRALFKEDFIKYIQYEINLLELIRKRRARTRYFFKKEEIEFSIVHRIQNLFRRATSKWKEDIQLWMSHIAFCKKWNNRTQISKLFSSLLAIHPNKPALWIMAAKWEMEDCLSSESARHLFLRALRFHPESPKLYQEYFRMELMSAEKQRKEKQEFEQAKMDLDALDYPEEVLNGGLARIVYKEAVSKIKGAEFHLSLLSIAKLFTFAQDLQKEIYDHLQVLHAGDPLTWDFVARRELELESQLPEEVASKQRKAAEVARREERCCAVYEEAVSSLATEAMWKCYITFCLERFNRKTNNKELREKRQERAVDVFKRAHEAMLLSEDLYQQWLDLLLGLGFTETALGVALAITDCCPDSAARWQLQLQLLIRLESSKVDERFEEAVRHLKAKDCLPLWSLWAEWSEGTHSEADTEALFQKSLLATAPADSAVMKEKYLDWAYRTGGRKKAKRVFISLRENRPFSVQFFRRMIQIEKEQETCKMLNLREYYERALREFGSVNSDLWLDYIKEELNHPCGKPENCGQIHWRAMKMLQGGLVEEFVAKYTLLQIGQL
ncbi:U3 small nucleolar RNA-associated protein 6 homolog isoform X2 [Trichosurus vulpecula]|uniref:U3 small nucleolar RNA-associated protein 6 homolog isoform X2 n=1 Tax=Trichosurus vulpecula TaxID=9337 RepID=UPI00186B5464|nr:U3 small nucleolar RNA-associated protein 6 homolog isoform X2 [Trichosurus vulpecula]